MVRKCVAVIECTKPWVMIAGRERAACHDLSECLVVRTLARINPVKISSSRMQMKHV